MYILVGCCSCFFRTAAILLGEDGIQRFEDQTTAKWAIATPASDASSTVSNCLHINRHPAAGVDNQHLTASSARWSAKLARSPSA